MLLGGDSHHEGRNVDNLLSNGDVSLSNHNSSVVHTVGELSLGHQGLESSLHELVGGQSKHEIQFSLVSLQQTKSDNSLDEGVSFENSSGVGLIEGEELSGSLSELGESELDSPDFSLVLEAVSTDNLELAGESILVERLLGGLRCFTVVCVSLWHVWMLPIGLSAIDSE